MDTIREAFEEWIKTILPTTFAPNLQYKDGKYTQFAMQESWEAWQAATEASAVEIAALKKAAYYDGYTDRELEFRTAQAAAIPAGYVLCKAEQVGELLFDAQGDYINSVVKPIGTFLNDGVPLYAQERDQFAMAALTGYLQQANVTYI